MKVCPICGGSTEVSVRRESLPVFNNVTYPTRDEARCAPVGRFALATCRSCGFSHNGDFDPDLVTYDENYDNHVESAVFNAYYSDLVGLMNRRFELNGGTVYDIGCGDGEFLKVLCEAAPDVSGVGIDPSCHPIQDGNFRLTKGTPDEASLLPDARLVILRHVLEHIDDPVGFLTGLREAVPDAPFFIEVPDLNWILTSGAFWDFTYEHCNYFTLPTLRLTLETAGFSVVEQHRSFGDQYQWAICRPADDRPSPQKNRVGNADSELAAVQAYLAVEADRLATISELAEGPDHFVLWGMSGKGVILASLLPEGLVSGGIDMNRAKQGRYAPTSALRIHSPEWLTGVGGSTVLVMNPNYATEIGNLVKRLGANARLITV
jgi:hypothetical protein